MSLKAIYRCSFILNCRDPEDVDLLIGANFEKWHLDAVVGPVSVCLIGEQFRNLKYADRFFYSHENQFTPSSKKRKRIFSPGNFSFHQFRTTRIYSKLQTSMLFLSHNGHRTSSTKSVPTAGQKKVKNLSSFQRNKMKFVSFRNPTDSCSQCPPFDFSPWRL